MAFVTSNAVGVAHCIKQYKNHHNTGSQKENDNYLATKPKYTECYI